MVGAQAHSTHTCEKYAGNTHRWSSNREHWTRSSSSNRSFVAPRKRSSLATFVGDRNNGNGFNGWSDCTVDAVVHAPIDWRLHQHEIKNERNAKFSIYIWVFECNLLISSFNVKNYKNSNCPFQINTFIRVLHRFVHSSKLKMLNQCGWLN